MDPTKYLKEAEEDAALDQTRRARNRRPKMEGSAKTNLNDEEVEEDADGLFDPGISCTQPPAL